MSAGKAARGVGVGTALVVNRLAASVASRWQPTQFDRRLTISDNGRGRGFGLVSSASVAGRWQPWVLVSLWA